MEVNPEGGRSCQERRELRSCPRICIGGIKDNRLVVTAEEIGLHRDDPVIRLSLRKPRNWNWKLTTSASSPAVILPAVCLVDSNGNVLHDERKRGSPGRDSDMSSRSEKNINRPMKYVREQARQERSFSVPVNKDILQSRPNNRTPVDRATSEEATNYQPKRRTRQTRNNMSPAVTQSVLPDDLQNGNIRTDHRHRRKQDSGYKSLRKGAEYMPRCRRQSSDTSEALAEFSRRWKRKHRKAIIIGDLLAINGQQTRLCDQTEDPLKTVSDGQLTPSRRNDSSPSSRRPRRRQRRQSPLSAMGSNVSRHSGKGMSGRRTQSSGNLCNGNKILSRDVGRILATCSHVGPKDRNRLCGSLPNYLDGEYGGHALEVRCCNNNNNNNKGVECLVSSESDVASSSVGRKSGLELRLAPQLDATLHDQGYASERSPEDEHAPPLPDRDPPLRSERESFWWLTQHYPFITAGASFDVTLLKGNRGLGLSVTGGVDTGDQWPGLIRIKRLFPHQPASQCGQLASGDILLAANGVPLTGLTNYQALEVLRTTPNNVQLAVCRPPSDVFSVTLPAEPPLPPRRDPSLRVSTCHTMPLPLLHIQEPYGEFDIMLRKVNRSLGFTLRKEDESVLGHYVRALVREPALSDGRIRPGDKIVEVNDVPLSPMSHEEAVTFLRQCGETVKLRLYRDPVQTPVAALSPTETDPGGYTRPRPMLRQEARDMLSDLAVRKLSPSAGNSSGSGHGLLHCSSGGSSPGTSPHRRRLTRTPSPDIHTVTQDRFSHRHATSSHYEGSDNPEECRWSNTFTMSNAEVANVPYNSEVSVDTQEGEYPKPQRPQFLNLSSKVNSPQASRKQTYAFSVTSTKTDEASDFLTLTSESELATQDTLSPGYPTSSEELEGPLMEPVSLPPLSSTSSTSTAFSYRNPAYQSAHPTCNGARKPADGEAATECLSDQDLSGKVFDEPPGGKCSLLKWKGVVFPQQNGVQDGRDNSISTDVATENEQILTVELNRGWNSRLGFSLQADGFRTYISAIYADSVAARDGRLRAQDQLLTVNDENVENMTTAEIIDLLRKIRGTIEIRVLRKWGPMPQLS